jgi:hypothetical protein
MLATSKKKLLFFFPLLDRFLSFAGVCSAKGSTISYSANEVLEKKFSKSDAIPSAMMKERADIQQK